MRSLGANTVLPRVITRAAEAADLLEEARAAKSLVLRHGKVRKMRGVAQTPHNDAGLKDGVSGQSELAGAILRADRSEELGHAPAWLDAASVYEELVEYAEREGSADFVFCMDPWSAQLLTHANELMPGARWIAVINLQARKAGEYGDYWESLEGWIAQLPFESIVAQDAWESALRGTGDEGCRRPQSHPADRVHLARAGAWGWRTVSGPSVEQNPELGDVLLLTRFSGSVPHFRVLLESIARQSCPKHSLSLVVLAPSGADDLKYYLSWFALAQPEVQIKLVDAVPDAPRDWEDLNRQLHNLAPGAAAAVLDDYAVLPTDFCASIRRAVDDGHRRVRYASISVEASAHVITGNLDSVLEYDKLLRAFGGSDAAASEPPARGEGQILSSQAWRRAGAADLERLMEGGGPSASSVVRPHTSDHVLLRLSDVG